MQAGVVSACDVLQMSVVRGVGGVCAMYQCLAQSGVRGVGCECSCSPSETYGRKWGDSNFQIFTELPVPPQAAGVVGTF